MNAGTQREGLGISNSVKDVFFCTVGLSVDKTQLIISTWTTNVLCLQISELNFNLSRYVGRHTWRLLLHRFWHRLGGRASLALWAQSALCQDSTRCHLTKKRFWKNKNDPDDSYPLCVLQEEVTEQHHFPDCMFLRDTSCSSLDKVEVR